MPTETPLDKTPSSDVTPDSWRLLRDAAVLQVKLIVDGFRDLLLVPASLIAAAISLATGEDGKPGPQFYRLLALGKQSERMINLFGAYENAPEEVQSDYDFGNVSLDDLVERVETFVVDEYKKGGLTKQAKERLDEALRAVQRAARE